MLGHPSLSLGSRATPEVGEQPPPALQGRAKRCQRQLPLIYVTSAAGNLGKMLPEASGRCLSLFLLMPLLTHSLAALPSPGSIAPLLLLTPTEQAKSFSGATFSQAPSLTHV